MRGRSLCGVVVVFSAVVLLGGWLAATNEHGSWSSGPESSRCSAGDATEDRSSCVTCFAPVDGPEDCALRHLRLGRIMACADRTPSGASEVWCEVAEAAPPPSRLDRLLGLGSAPARPPRDAGSLPPATSVLRAGSYLISLAGGWFEEPRAHGGRWWFGRRGAALRARVDVRMAPLERHPVLAARLRAFFQVEVQGRDEADAAGVALDVSPFLPASSRAARLGAWDRALTDASGIVSGREARFRSRDHVEVVVRPPRRFGRGWGLPIAGEIREAKLRFLVLIANSESDDDVAVPALDRLVITWPSVSHERDGPLAEAFLDSVTIEPEPRSRSCGERIIAAKGESCRSCCSDGPTWWQAECLDLEAAAGGEERCRREGCVHVCQPSDPEGIQWNKIKYALTGSLPKGEHH